MYTEYTMTLFQEINITWVNYDQAFPIGKPDGPLYKAMESFIKKHTSHVSILNPLKRTCLLS